MTMDILPDLNIIVDLLIFERKGHLIALEINNIIKEKGFSKWMAASSIDNLGYTLLSEAKRFNLKYADKIRFEFKKLLSETKIFSVTGASIREAINAKDLEDHIIYTNFRRIAPDGIVISNDIDFRSYPAVINPEEFIKTHETLSASKIIPMLDLKAEYRYMLEDIDYAVLKNIADTKYILGPEVKMLEDKMSGYLGVKHCIGCSSGTEALVLSLRALAIKLKGQEYFDRTDEIITTPFTFTATGDAILRAGATPVFVDINPATYNIDPQKIKVYLTQNSKLKTRNSGKIIGILPVHLYGQSCQMDEIMEIARKHNLFVVEDIAQSFGAEWKRVKLGAIGTTGCFSFFPSKNLGGFGDGGMVSTQDDEIAGLVRMLLRHGGKDKYNVDHIGYNARLDTLQAAIVLAKFKYIDEFNERRRNIAEIYNKELAGIEGIVLPAASNLSLNSEPPTLNLELGTPNPERSVNHVYHQYTVKTSKRGDLQAHLKEKGISTMVYYPFPLHKMKVFSDGRSKVAGSLSHAEHACSNVFSLPVEPLQNKNDTTYIIESIKEFFKPYE